MTGTYVPARGDLVWVVLYSRAGHEQSGHRPAIVLSPQEYNGKVGLALLCPVTSKHKGYPFEVSLPDGLRITGVVLCDRIMSVDWRARKLRRMGRAPREVVSEVLAKAATLLR